MIEHAVNSSALIERREALYNMIYRYFVCDKGNVSGMSGLERVLTGLNSEVPLQ